MVSAFLLFALKPTITVILELWQEINIKQSFNQRLDKKIQDLQKAQLMLAQSKKLAELANKALPSSPEFSLLEREIEYLAYKNNLILVEARFKNIELFGSSKSAAATNKIKESKPEDNRAAIIFNLKIGGNYEDIKNFLKDLNNLDRLIISDQVSFNQETDIEGAEVQIMMQAKAFYYPMISVR